MGLLEIKPGEGTFIRQTSVDSIIQPLALVLMMEHDSIFELLEVRMILEVESAALAAVRATPEELQEMEEALIQMETHVDDDKNLGAKADIKFHYAVANATHNRLFLRLMNTISDSIEHSVQINRQKLYESPEIPKKLVKEHQAIYQAIKSGDEKMARDAMYKHLSGVVAQLSKSIK
jgi:GntR family transcriptional regulator, transcriptional repressor for pyruvate dehydrogenase complex